MPQMTITLPHGLSAEEALKRIKELLGKVKEEQGSQIGDLEEQWSDNSAKFSFKVKGFPVSGTMTVHGDRVELMGEIPRGLSLHTDKIKYAILEQGSKLLE